MAIGDQNLRNEFLMAPVKTGYSDGDGRVTERHLHFYRRRADHVGAITPEPLYLDPALRELPDQMGIDDDDKIDGLSRLTETIHAGGAAAIAHLNHPGRMSNPDIEGTVQKSASATPCARTGVTPERMDHDEIQEAIDLYGEAARRAEAAGFDVIELQFGHGYLAAQFFSPAVNDREDGYGGSIENRARFAREVLGAVQDSSDLPILARITADDKIEGGIDFEDAQWLAETLEDSGVDAFHVTTGSICGRPPYFFQHMFTPKGDTWEYAERLGGTVDVPVVAVGRINEHADVDRLREESATDLIAVGRALVADPDFIGKYLGEVAGRVRPCMACSDGCLGGVKSGEGLGCVINPDVAREDELRFEPAPEHREYAVVGGGPAGLSAAEVLGKRGHEVTLFEANELGGAFRYAPLPPGKDPLRKGIDYFRDTLADLDTVEFAFREATADDLSGYDEVLLATGSEPAVPPIDGLEDVEYAGAEILETENLPRKERIMVIGGGYVGLEAADTLAEAGNDVLVIELLPDLGGNMIALEKGPLLERLSGRDHVELHRETDLIEVRDERAVAEKNGDRLSWEGIDQYVVATGVESYVPFQDDLDVPTHLVGDAVEPGKAEDAIASGYDTARSL
jgi:2,4-dienoyl-CoA reductase (NADPH2)